MKFRLRTLFLITTVVAIVVFTFTLGSAEGVFTTFFFACIFGSQGKKDRWTAGLFLVISLIGTGTVVRLNTLSGLENIYFGESACIDIVFTGQNQQKQEEVFLLLKSKPPFSESCIFSSRSSTIPFLRTGYVRLGWDEEKQERCKLVEFEAEVRRQIAEAFPDLRVRIEGHSTSDGK